MKLVLWMVMLCIFVVALAVEARVERRRGGLSMEEQRVKVEIDGKIERKSYAKLYRELRAGVKHHKRGNYKKAYEKLSVCAQWGLKQAQYLMAFMYLKGQYVEQSVEIGMGWLGVAKEVEIKEWSDTYDNVYKMLSPQQQALVDKKVDKYIKQYGMEVQKIDCVNKARLGGGKIEPHCQKRVNAITPLYELENAPSG